jgi:hypothetical protein
MTFAVLGFGCVDLTEPWKQGGTGGTRSDASALEDALGPAGTGGDLAGNVGSGGRGGVDVATASEGGGAVGGIDVAPGGADERFDGRSDGRTVDGVEETDGGASDTDPIADTSIAGTGGAAAGGAGGRSDAGAGGVGGKSTGDSGGRKAGGSGGRGGSAGSATGGKGSGGSAGNGGGSGGSGGKGGGAGGMGSGGSAISDAGADVVVFPTGLLLYYPCEQAVGATLRDESGRGNDGTLPNSRGGYAFETGKVGKALRLNAGNRGYVSIPTGVFKDATDLTIATWIKVTASSRTLDRIFDVGVDAKLAHNKETGTAYMTFLLDDPFNNGEHSFSSTKDGYSNAKRVAAPARAIPSNGWTHIAVTLGAGVATLYVDGKSVATETSVVTPKDLGPIDYAYLGRSQFTDDPYLDALIDELRVYSRALSADEIQSLVDYVP